MSSNPKGKTQLFPGAGVQDKEIEKALVGSLLIQPQYLLQVSGIVTAEDFYYLSCRTIYEVLLELHTANKPVERVHITEALKSRPQALERFGGLPQAQAFVSELTNAVPTAMYAVQYATLVQYYSRRRLVVARAHEIANRVNANEMEHAEALDLLEQTAREAQFGNMASDDLVSIYDAVLAQITSIEQPDTEPVRRYTSGLDQLNDLLGGGFRKNEMYVHGGRPGMGKTSAVLKYGLAAARQMRDSGWNEMVVLVTLEMSIRELTNRLLAALSGVEYLKLDRQDELSADEYRRLYNAVAELTELKQHFYFWNPSSVTPEEIWRKLRQVQLEMNRPVGAVIVDHMHIMSAPGNVSTDERIKYTYIIDRFRDMRDNRNEATQEYTVNATWHIVGQLSRKCEERRDKRPLLADFRETGKIEEHANGIIVYYRGSQYYKDLKDDRTMEIIIRKARGAATGTAKAVFFGETYALENPAVGVDDDDAPPPSKPVHVDLTLL